MKNCPLKDYPSFKNNLLYINVLSVKKMKKYKMYVLRNDQRLQFNDDSILRNECQARTTRVLHEPYECYTNDMSVTRVKMFDFHNDMSENIFLHPIPRGTVSF